MKNSYAFHSVASQRKVFTSLLAAAVCCLGLLISPWLSSSAMAQDLFTYNHSGAGPCTLGVCCAEFSFQPTHCVNELDVQLLSSNGSTQDTCIDWACLAAQFASPGQTYTKTGVGSFKITFSPAVCSGQILFYICPTSTSWPCSLTLQNDWTAFDFQEDSSGIQVNSGTGPVYVCNGGNHCPSCDSISYFPGGSEATICFYHGSHPPAKVVHQIVLIVCPDFAPCNFPGQMGTDTITPPPGWLWGGHIFDLATKCGKYTFNSNGGGLQPCDEFCINVAKCFPHGTTHTLTFTCDSPACAHTVAPSDTESLKQAFGNGAATITIGPDQPSSYPNPVTSSSMFKTTIPFVTHSKGSARITIVDESGKQILQLNQDVAYAGTHFFYFSGQTLPAGIYYYKVEYPLGEVIVNKTILLVK